MSTEQWSRLSTDAFNVGTGTGNSVKEVLAAVESVVGRKVPHTVGPRRAGDPARLVAKPDKIQRALGWKPEFADLRKNVATAWNFEEKKASVRTTRQA